MYNYRDTDADFKNRQESSDVHHTHPMIDIWTPTVSYHHFNHLVNSWIPNEHRRRLASYKLLHAIYNNCHKVFIRRDGILEYGDAALVVDTLRDAMLGSSGIRITAADIETNKDVQNRVTRLTKWWRDELIDTKIFENETNCTSLGDSVYRLRWVAKPGKKPTVKVDTFDPGFFFPVFDEDDELITVFLAWEEEIFDGNGNSETRIYKEKYELVNDVCHVTAGWYKHDPGSSIKSPYTLDDLTLINYKIVDDVELNMHPLSIDFIPIIYVPNINVQGEPFGKSDLATVIDLFSEIANTNTDMAANTSLLGSPPLVVKSDDVYGGDEENEDGESVSNTVGPGETINVGANGDAKVLDVSELNTALDAYLKRLDQKLYENTRATKLAAGKMEGSMIPSGISLRLMQNPLVQKTLPKRILRSYKLQLMLKFVQKMFAMFGEQSDADIFSGDDYSVLVEFGDIFPTDRSQAINDLAVAFTGGFLSLETAVRMCVKLGIEIDDVMKEVERIRKDQEILNTFNNISNPPGDGTQSHNHQATKDGTVVSDNKQSENQD